MDGIDLVGVVGGDVGELQLQRERVRAVDGRPLGDSRRECVRRPVLHARKPYSPAGLPYPGPKMMIAFNYPSSFYLRRW